MKMRLLTTLALTSLLASPASAGPTVKKKSWVTEGSHIAVLRFGWGEPIAQSAFSPRLSCRAPEIPLVTNILAVPSLARRVIDRGAWSSTSAERLGAWRVRIRSTNGGPVLVASGTGWTSAEANAPAGLAPGLPFAGGPGGFWVFATFQDTSGVVIDDQSLLGVTFDLTLTVACGTADFDAAGAP